MSTTNLNVARSNRVLMVDRSDIVLMTLGTNCRRTMAQAAEIIVESIQWQMLYGYHDVHGLPGNPHTEIVDTGRLFDSIRADIVRDSQNAYTVDYGTDVSYAIFVHDGTRFLAPRPFIRDGTYRCIGQVRDALTTGIPIGLR